MLRLYIEGTLFVIWTNPQELSFILDLKKRTDTMTCWRLRMHEYDFEAVHRPGRHCQALFATLRLPKKSDKNEEEPVEDTVPTLDEGSNGRPTTGVIMAGNKLKLMPSVGVLKDVQRKHPNCIDSAKIFGRGPRWINCQRSRISHSQSTSWLGIASGDTSHVLDDGSFQRSLPKTACMSWV